MAAEGGPGDSDGAGGHEAGPGALDDQGAFGLGEGGEDEERDPAGDRVSGVDPAVQRAHADAAAGEVVDKLEQRSADAAGSVESGDDQDVAGVQPRQEGVRTGRRPAPEVVSVWIISTPAACSCAPDRSWVRVPTRVYPWLLMP